MAHILVARSSISTMSRSLCQAVEVQPEESVLQVMNRDTSDDEEDFYGDSVIHARFHQPSPSGLSRSSNTSKSLSAYFMITPETEEEGRRFLKVLPGVQSGN